MPAIIKHQIDYISEESDNPVYTIMNISDTIYRDIVDRYDFSSLEVGIFNPVTKEITKIPSDEITTFPKHGDTVSESHLGQGIIYRNGKKILSLPLKILSIISTKLYNHELHRDIIDIEWFYPVPFTRIEDYELTLIYNESPLIKYDCGKLRDIRKVHEMEVIDYNLSELRLLFPKIVNGVEVEPTVMKYDLGEYMSLPKVSFMMDTWGHIIDVVKYVKSHYLNLNDFFRVGDERPVGIKIGDTTINSAMVILHINPNREMCLTSDGDEVYDHRPGLVIGFKTPTNYFNPDRINSAIIDYERFASNPMSLMKDQLQLFTPDRHASTRSRVVDKTEDINILVDNIIRIAYIPLNTKANKINASDNTSLKIKNSQYENSINYNLSAVLTRANYFPIDGNDSKVFDYFKRSPMDRVKYTINKINGVSKPVIQYIHDIESFTNDTDARFACINTDGNEAFINNIFQYRLNTDNATNIKSIQHFTKPLLNNTDFTEFVISEYFVI